MPHCKWAECHSSNCAKCHTSYCAEYYTGNCAEYYTGNYVRHHTVSDILNFNSSIVLPGRALLEELILCIALLAGAIFSSILLALLGVYWKQAYWEAADADPSQ